MLLLLRVVCRKQHCVLGMPRANRERLAWGGTAGGWGQGRNISERAKEALTSHHSPAQFPVAELVVPRLCHNAGKWLN